MIYSTDRILTTHAGSLPRPDDLKEMVLAKARGEPCDQAALEARLRSAVAEIVERQVDCGLDLVNDGELSKPNFTDYVSERIAGCESRPGTGFRGRIDLATPHPLGLTIRSVCLLALEFQTTGRSAPRQTIKLFGS